MNFGGYYADHNAATYENASNVTNPTVSASSIANLNNLAVPTTRPACESHGVLSPGV